MFPEIVKLIEELVTGFDQIPAERKAILERIAAYITTKKGRQETVKLVFICTHNSRRSHFGQIAAALAADYFSVEQVEVFSGGTEATAFHPNAIQALRVLGFKVDSADETAANPIWEVHFGQNQKTTCFSKVFNHPSNPTTGFAAIMTCSDAEQNCPFVPGTELRIGTTYNDPKLSDGTSAQAQTYQDRFKQIATELLYAFSQVK